jgi:hypothetical protein
MTEIVRKAAEVTHQIQQNVGKALDILDHAFNGRIINGARIYIRPGVQEDRLLEALKELNAAKMLLAEWRTRWPKEADYDETEREDREEARNWPDPPPMPLRKRGE